MFRMVMLHRVLISSLLVLTCTGQAGNLVVETDIWTNPESSRGAVLDAAAHFTTSPNRTQGQEVSTRTTKYYLADRVIRNNDFAKLANWGINTAIVDFDVNGSSAAWRAVFTSAAAAHIDIVIWPSDWDNPRPHCGWEAPYPISAHGNIEKVKPLLDVASQYTNFIGIVNAHESFWTCDMSFDEMAGLKDQLKAYTQSKGHEIKVWNYIDNLYSRAMLPDNQLERIMDVAVTWQHCAGGVEGPCNTSSPTSALSMILNDRQRIADSGAQVELVFLIQTFTTTGYSTKFTLTELQNYSCEFLNTSALDGFGFYTWHAGWWSDLHRWPDVQPAVRYIYESCARHFPGLPIISGNAGAADVRLRYMDGTAKTVTSQTDGRYSFAVSYNWSGTVTPSKRGTAFTPTRRTYTNVTTNKSAQNYTPILTTAVSFRSAGGQDGWVLESSETSNQGGIVNPTANWLILGDNANDRQYRSLLHFNTASLPDNATIARVVLKIQKQSLTGTNPFTTHGKITVDIRKGAFCNAAVLQTTDFQAAADKPAVGLIADNPQAGGWYVSILRAIAYPYINRTGITQLRLQFALDDNDDLAADFMRFFSGNAPAANRPKLIIEYYIR